MKLTTFKSRDYILISMEAENEAEKHQLKAIEPALISDAADFYTTSDIRLVDEKEVWILKGIHVRVRLRPMPADPRDYNKLNVMMDELMEEKAKEFRDMGVTPEMVRSKLDRIRANKAAGEGKKKSFPKWIVWGYWPKMTRHVEEKP